MFIDYCVLTLSGVFSASSRGRVVKAMDLKSIGLCPHRFESCRLRNFNKNCNIHVKKGTLNMNFLIFVICFFPTLNLFWFSLMKGSSLGYFSEYFSGCTAVVAEWLRRLTRNQLGSPRTGSNPVGCEILFSNSINFLYWVMSWYGIIKRCIGVFFSPEYTLSSTKLSKLLIPFILGVIF